MGFAEHNLLTGFEAHWLEIFVDSLWKRDEWSVFWFENRNPNTAFTVIEDGHRRSASWKDFSLSAELLKTMYLDKNQYTIDEIKENRLSKKDQMLRCLVKSIYDHHPFNLFVEEHILGGEGNLFYPSSRKTSSFRAGIKAKKVEIKMSLC